MLNKLFCFFLLALPMIPAAAQDSLLTEDVVLKIAIDPLNQVYYINNQRQLFKLASTQDKTFFYTALFLNRNTVLNVQNPFKVLLFKEDTGELVTLDTRMTTTGSVNLFDLGYFDVSALSSANDLKSIWLFDRARQQLIRLDQQYKESFTSPVMPQQIGTSLSPVFLTETEGKVYVSDPEKGIYVFDNLGNYYRNLPIKGIRKLWIIGPRLYYFSEGKLWQYDTLLMETAPLMDISTYADIQLCKEFILGLTSDGKLYKIRWPAKN